MPYCIINNQPVFLSSQRLKKLKSLSLKDKTPKFRIDSEISPKEYKEADKLMHSFLKSQYKQDTDSFESEWIKFDMTGSEASENIWNLL